MPTTTAWNNSVSNAQPGDDWIFARRAGSNNARLNRSRPPRGGQPRGPSANKDAPARRTGTDHARPASFSERRASNATKGRRRITATLRGASLAWPRGGNLCCAPGSEKRAHAQVVTTAASPVQRTTQRHRCDARYQRSDIFAVVGDEEAITMHLVATVMATLPPDAGHTPAGRSPAPDRRRTPALPSQSSTRVARGVEPMDSNRRHRSGSAAETLQAGWDETRPGDNPQMANRWRLSRKLRSS